MHNNELVTEKMKLLKEYLGKPPFSIETFFDVTQKAVMEMSDRMVGGKQEIKDNEGNVLAVVDKDGDKKRFKEMVTALTEISRGIATYMSTTGEIVTGGMAEMLNPVTKSVMSEMKTLQETLAVKMTGFHETYGDDLSFALADALGGTSNEQFKLWFQAYKQLREGISTKQWGFKTTMVETDQKFIQ